MLLSGAFPLSARGGSPASPHTRSRLPQRLYCSLPWTLAPSSLWPRGPCCKDLDSVSTAAQLGGQRALPASQNL